MRVQYRAVTPKKASADLAMATVKEEQIALGEIEKNLAEEQNDVEKQKIEYDEKVTKKEDLIAKVSVYIIILFFIAFYQNYYDINT